MERERETTLDLQPMSIVYRNGHGEQDTFALERRPLTTIGRAIVCDIVLGSQHVSRRHASIELVEGQHLLRDLESANGTFLNGLRVSRTYTFALREGDVIEIGSERMTYGPLNDLAKTPFALETTGGAAFPLADLIRDGYARLDPSARTALQTSIQRAFAETPGGVGLDRSAGIVMERLGAQRVAVLLADVGRKLRPVAARPSFEAITGLLGLAERAWSSGQGQLAHGLAPLQPHVANETCVQAKQSLAAAPFSQGVELSGVIAVERTAAKRLDRSDLALLAVLSDRVLLTLALSGASAMTTVSGLSG